MMSHELNNKKSYDLNDWLLSCSSSVKTDERWAKHLSFVSVPFPQIPSTGRGQTGVWLCGNIKPGTAPSDMAKEWRKSTLQIWKESLLTRMKKKRTQKTHKTQNTLTRVATGLKWPWVLEFKELCEKCWTFLGCIFVPTWAVFWKSQLSLFDDILTKVTHEPKCVFWAQMRLCAKKTHLASRVFLSVFVPSKIICLDQSWNPTIIFIEVLHQCIFWAAKKSIWLDSTPQSTFAVTHVWSCTDHLMLVRELLARFAGPRKHWNTLNPNRTLPIFVCWSQMCSRFTMWERDLQCFFDSTKSRSFFFKGNLCTLFFARVETLCAGCTSHLSPVKERYEPLPSFLLLILDVLRSFFWRTLIYESAIRPVHSQANSNKNTKTKHQHTENWKLVTRLCHPERFVTFFHPMHAQSFVSFGGAVFFSVFGGFFVFCACAPTAPWESSTFLFSATS